VSSHSDEFKGAELGDQRLNKRLLGLAEQLAPQPERSVPAAAGGDAALEATYRFLNNERVTPEAILAPHLSRTNQRCAAAEHVIVAHDTTEFRWAGDREGLGHLTNGKGFLGHFALAVGPGEGRAPLGLLAVSTIFRSAPHRLLRGKRADQDRESWRWWKGVEDSAGTLADSKRAIHVMDREADIFDLLARLVSGGHRFVVRSCHDRRLETQWPDTGWLKARVQLAEDLFLREVPISARRVEQKNKDRRAHPPRESRTAKLALGAARVTLRSPAAVDGKIYPKSSLAIHVVRAHEIDPPDNCEPIEWLLLTTEPVDSIEQIAFVVDAYRARWRIEEFFKALKTGCGFEKRQLETRRSLLNAMAVLAPIAWQLLRLRSLSREDPSRPAADVLSPLQLQLLRKHPNLKLSSDPSTRDAMLAVAQLGGHIKNNGDPGWIVLGRGFEKLLLLEQGALLRTRCDQS
jgi:hypothetical protein